MMSQSVARHSITACDRELRADPRFDPFHCTPSEFVCSCGRVWEHVCDEAEGCSYWQVEDFHKLSVQR